MRIFYLRDERKVPLVCVVSEKGTDDYVDELDPMLTAKVDVVYFAVSTCHPSDESVFNKKLGRHIAQSRLEMGKHDSVVRNRNVKWDILNYIASDEHNFPKRTRALAERWLSDHPLPIVQSHNESALDQLSIDN